MTKLQKHPYRAIFRDDPYGWKKFEREGNGFGFVGAIHKAHSEEIPHRIVNEFVSGEIGRFLQFDKPPLGISRHKDRDRQDVLFTGLDFNYDRDALPPITPEVCVEKLPLMSAGILLFDILIANPDRNETNLHCDDGGNPKTLVVFDHDVALLGTKHDGLPRLRTQLNKLGSV